MLENALEDEVLSEKPDAVKHFSTLVIFSPHAVVLALIPAMVYPTNCLLITRSLPTSSLGLRWGRNLAAQILFPASIFFHLCR